ncbi:MAG: hypothetical protein GSR72_03925 [Desulfurococcales archaeon]|nr:hypothetical protein [Desulfurococcales archaeon]MEB3789022.1 hypothetical protein [Desulfurococcales archaeon]
MSSASSIIAKIRRGLDKIKEKFEKGDRNGMVLTILALERALKNKDKVSIKDVVFEARNIIKKREINVSWGVSYSEYNEELARKLVRELVELGLVEELEGGYYRFRYIEDLDPRAEIYARFGHLLLYGGPAR